MATILPMSPEFVGHGYDAASRGNPATASLSEVASAALADAGDSDSSQNSRSGTNGTQLVLGSSDGSKNGSQTDDTSPRSALSVKQDSAAPPRLHTPEQQIGAIKQVSTSPQDGSLKPGAKRTASGAVKALSNGYQPAPTLDTPQNYGQSRGHVRAKSSMRAVEISSALKARLAYAMVKVNNGWENQNLDQLESISRMSSPSITSPSTTSPTRRRFSMNSDYNDRYISSPNMQQSPQQPYASRTAYAPTQYAQYAAPMPQAALTYGPSNGMPQLAPAAPIDPGRTHRRSLSSKAPPMLSTARGYNAVDYNSQPTTPRRQGILRMPSQQAEKDALDSLLFMASPNNSSNLKYTDSPAGPSPLRSEFPAQVKRVVFEN